MAFKYNVHTGTIEIATTTESLSYDMGNVGEVNKVNFDCGKPDDIGAFTVDFGEVL